MSLSHITSLWLGARNRNLAGREVELGNVTAFISSCVCYPEISPGMSIQHLNAEINIWS